ncbi:restriction endonuclease subunit S [Selenomonas flueggei]|uniref:Type I restriction modification DNA specificity domain protein n=1 Tax=Selenomonas flueggei ATCC 43531 TaxID=638302 RepID=C4V1C3_9FIRM|nr:restriction endonuclease subunit S [Selenomonas flueggei]EEQ49459.1 type I restriction modification DNA specificity domain protein [Selenomonas flueggei ATCC 43531]
MSRLREMIKELCPDGVEYKKLGEIATNVFRGAGIKRDELTAMGIPCVRYGEIYTTYGIWFDSCVSHTDETFLTNPKYFGHGDILFAITGESVEEIAKSTAYIGHDKCVAGGDIVVLQHEQNPKYLSYVLSTDMAQRQKSKGRVKSKVVHSSVPAIKEIVIPVPPLPIQNEIVKMLDNFTELTAELTAELTLRKKQYSFYRDSLLNFSRDDAEVEWKTLGETTKSISSGKNKIRVVDGEYPVYGSTGIIGYCTNFVYEHAQILVARVGSVGYVQIADGRYDVSDNTLIVDVLSTINMKYIFYYLGYMNLSRLAHGAGQPLITAGQLKKLIIPIPPLETQAKIVSILDRFDELCHDLTQGLPAEIAARKKQYEYYREKLLTFPRKGTSARGAR